MRNFFDGNAGALEKADLLGFFCLAEFLRLRNRDGIPEAPAGLRSGGFCSWPSVAPWQHRAGGWTHSIRRQLVGDGVVKRGAAVVDRR